mgnify:CR=1 FL=1
MALAETLLRKVHKYELIPRSIKLLPVISFVVAVSSVLWLAWLPLDGNYRNVYISENALMPSQVMSYFRESEWNIVRGYRTEVSAMESLAIDGRNAIIESWFRDFGLVTEYHQNGKTNDTLYAVMHAPRGDDTEAMVLATPWITSDGEYNEGGMALTVALARYFSRMSIWSKNIVIVIPETGHLPLRSWVDAYHTSLEITAGSIDAAIVMEYGKNGDYFDYFEMIYEGLNGQLPNLDLLNTASLIAYHENIHCSIQNTKGDQLSKNTYFTRLAVLVKGIAKLALAGLNRNTPGCEAFSGWQIQAVTIRARGNLGPNDVTQFGRIVDSTFRSVNNLLEKFHQSFFFYLLMNPRNFVSIGTYLPAAVLVTVSFALSSLGCLLNSGVEFTEYVSSISNLLTIFTAIELFGAILSVVLPWLTINAGEEEDVVAGLILYTFTGLSFAISLSPIVNLNVTKFKLSKPTTYSLISLALFFISMLLVSLLIVHFSLALLLGLMTIPLTFIQPLITKSQRAKIFQMKQPAVSARKNPLVDFIKSHESQVKIVLCLLVSNPFFEIFLVGNYLNGAEGPIFLTRGLLTSWSELQCWTWFVVILGWFTAWLCVGLACFFGDFEIDHTELQTLKATKQE